MSRSEAIQGSEGGVVGSDSMRRKREGTVEADKVERGGHGTNHRSLRHLESYSTEVGKVVGKGVCCTVPSYSSRS